MSSSPTSSSISIASDDPLGPPKITMNEVALVLRDHPEMRTVIAHDFNEDQIGQLVLRWIVSLSDSLDHHRAEIQRLREERQFAVDYGNSNQSFVRRIRGLVLIHRQQQMEAALGSPLFNTPPSDAYQEPPEMAYPNTPPPLVLTSPVDENERENSPRSVEIATEEQNSPNEDSITSFYTAHSNEPGTQENPIDVDRLIIREDTPHPAIGFLQRTNSDFFPAITTVQRTRSESSLSLIHCRVCYAIDMAIALSTAFKWDHMFVLTVER